jgi:hypothetical protein
MSVYGRMQSHNFGNLWYAPWNNRFFLVRQYISPEYILASGYSCYVLDDTGEQIVTQNMLDMAIKMTPESLIEFAEKDKSIDWLCTFPDCVL